MMRIRTRRQSAVLAVTKRRNLAMLDAYGIKLPPQCALLASGSADPQQAFGVSFPTLHVDVGAVADRRYGPFVKDTNGVCRRAHDQRIVRKTLSFRTPMS